ncbi:TPA: rhodanese-like domain-containing protein [archaeon]|uniref:Rhodanese-like domain-containing protein n=1 Tax=Candidatus Undinarchaeum marinum TaxID=2756141 RepID=A0A832V0R9_9ARCH|nr:rhodanese-like domain-containing protein [Candidatus Undinarchaeum marinum]
MSKNTKINMNNIIMLAVVFGALSGALTTYYITSVQTPSQEDLIKSHYDTETAVLVSPHGLRKRLGDGTTVLVDVRSQEEYEEEHITGALNVPAYRDRDHSDYGAVERIATSFAEIKADNPNKDIIIYCYSMPCMTGRKVGKMLADRGIFVKELGIGWNEWRYFWTLWNHAHEWNITKPEDFITSGPEPGEMLIETGSGCPIEGDFGC